MPAALASPMTQIQRRYATSSACAGSWNQSSSSGSRDPLPRLAEHGPQDRLHLLELLGVRDQRRGELDHRVAAVVGAADQAAPVQLARQEAAKQLLRLRF